MRFRILILIHVCAAFPLKCPEPAHWSIRARSHCPDPSKYFCLKNDLINGFSENCTVFDFQQPGRKGVLRGGLDADLCSKDRYQPWPINFYTNVSTGCIFKKSVCNGEGQVVYGNGNRNTDSSCRCDYSVGYAFLVKPRNPCFCVPSEEDCSCYIKTCNDPTNMLTPDYECIHVAINTSAAHCKPIFSERMDREIHQNHTLDIPRKESISTQAQWKIFLGIIIGVICIGFIFAFCTATQGNGKSINCCKLSRTTYTTIPAVTNDSQLLQTNLSEDNNIERDQCYPDVLATMTAFDSSQAANGNQHDGKDALDSKFTGLHCKTQNELVNLDKRLNEHTNELAEQTGKIGKLEATAENPNKDFMTDTIKRWMDDDRLFIETRATKHVLLCVKQFSCVSVIGPSGCGKTALARHVALEFERNGYTVLTVTHATDIKTFYKSYRKTLYIVDDMCGNFTANQHRLEEWKKSMKDITSILKNSNCKLILTCRLQVFQDEGFTIFKIFKTCECNLISESLSLTYNEQLEMTGQYFQNYALIALNKLGKYECLPLLCKLYHVQRNDKLFKLEMFLNDPFFFYENELDEMKIDCKEGKYKYCALLLLVIFNNKLEKKNLKFDNAKLQMIIKDINKACSVHETLTLVILECQLKTLTGTFVAYEGYYKSIHDRLFDFLAFYFGTKEQDILLKHVNIQFVQERFVMTDINITYFKEKANYLIPVSSENSQVYIKRIFDGMVSDTRHRFDRRINHGDNARFRTCLLHHMKSLNNEDIAELYQTASGQFLNEIFVMTENDIEEYGQNRYDDYKRYGIVIPGDMVNAYIERWFDHLTQHTWVEDFMSCNRPLRNGTFCTLLRTYMRRISTENIATFIANGSTDFFNKLFVNTEDDIKPTATIQYECFGIVISDDLLQKYIETLFYYLIKPFPPAFIKDQCRPLKNDTFRIKLSCYMRQLNKEKISDLIDTVRNDVFNSLFVMSTDDIKANTIVQDEGFGVIIPDDLLQKYIDRWFNECLTNLRIYKDDCRPMLNAEFRTAVRTYMRQINANKIASLIHTDNIEILTKMFVMTEYDINEYATDPLERFGIVIPGNMLQPYIEKWFHYVLKTHTCVKKYINNSRPLINFAFRNALHTYIRLFTKEQIASLIQIGSPNFVNNMFVMTNDELRNNPKNRYECFGFVIPDCLLQQYLERWFIELTNTNQVDEFVCNCRPLVNVTFRSALRTFMKQLSAETIVSLISKGNNDFFNKMFVMTEIDIKDEYRSECIGIVISEDVLHSYIERWFEDLKKAGEFKKFLAKSRPFRNFTFRSTLQTYMTKMNTHTGVSLIRAGNETFFNEMFVMTKDDINDNGGDGPDLYGNSNPYDFGMVIPDDMLNQYIERWLDYFIQSCSIYHGSRPCRNHIYVTAVQNYMKQLTGEKIASIIQNGSEDFFYDGFVMTEDDIKTDSNHIHEIFGIIIPSDMLDSYIQRWFRHFKEGSYGMKLTANSRLLSNVTFRTALYTYIKELNTEHIDSLIQTGNLDFLYNAFIMSEADINEDGKYVFELFGIVIPSQLLNSYIERWFRHFKEGSYLMKLTANSRLLSNVTFRTALQTYIKEFNTEHIDSLIQTGNLDFLYNAFIMSDDDINEDGEYVFELFGIVIPSQLLNSYIERWFRHFKGDFNMAKLTDESRLFSNVVFRTAIRAYTVKLTTDKIVSLIQSESNDYINRMFVMTGDNIKDNAKYAYELFSIVIPDALLHQYIKRWFFHLINGTQLKECFNNCRALMNETFRTTLRSYMRQLSKDEIASLIKDGNHGFLNTMFVMSEDDIIKAAENHYKSFGILIPDDLLQQYIERWFSFLTVSFWLKEYIYNCRPLRDVSFRMALQTYLRKLSRDKIADLMRTTNRDFIRRMFVMSEDNLIESGENCYTCFGIVVPDDLLHLYISKLLKNYSCNFRNDNVLCGRRNMMNSRFRTAVRIYIGQLSSHRIVKTLKFVGDGFFDKMNIMTFSDMKKNDIYTDDMLIYYNRMVERLLVRLSKTDHVKEFIDGKGDFEIFKFGIDFKRYGDIIRTTLRTGLPTYNRQASTAHISYLIQTGSKDFLDRMFVQTKDDIKDTDHYECFGIVIPDILLQQYIERWFIGLTEANSVQDYMNNNRPLKNETFRSAVRRYMREINTEQITALIQNGNDDFLNTMFVVTDDDIVYNDENINECFGIVLPFDKVHFYVENLFRRFVKTNRVKEFMNKGRYITALHSYIQQLDPADVVLFIENGSTDFINTMFVMTEDDITYNNASRFENIGIIISDDMLHIFMERLFDHFTKSSKVTEFINSSRPLHNAGFRTALSTKLRQLSTDKIVFLMQTVSEDFFNKMFVITENDIKSNAENLYECFGIIIPCGLLEQYLKCWFHHVTKTSQVKEFMTSSRTMKNATFRIAMRIYLRKFNQDKMDYLIQTVTEDFFEQICVMTKDDVKDSNEHLDDVLQYYIERWFERLAKTMNVEEFLSKTRHLLSDIIRTAVRSYMQQLSKEKIISLIHTSNEDFFNKMFVMTKDEIKNDDEKRYMCFGIVIADDLLQHYIERWFESIIKENKKIQFTNIRPFMNIAFNVNIRSYTRQLSVEKISYLLEAGSELFFNKMFVMTEDDIKDIVDYSFECVGIVIPDDLLQQYIERWFKELTACSSTYSIDKFMNSSRPSMSATFYTELRLYLSQLSQENISFLISTGSIDFFSKIFVMSKDDIKINSEDRIERFGIVIPGDLLQIYIEQFFYGLTKTEYVKKCIDGNRCFFNDTFRKVLQTYTKQLSRWKIRKIIRTGSIDFVNTMFVVTEDDIKDNADNRYECFGIIIPVDLLQQYISRLVDGLTKTDSVTKCLDLNRCLMDVPFRIALQTYMKKLTLRNIANVIDTGSSDFVNTMFIMTEDDIKDNADNRYECFGIIIPVDLLQQYIKRLVNRLYNTVSVTKCLGNNRCLFDVTFRIALQTYLKQLPWVSIHNLISIGSIDFVNTMFVITEDDIKQDDEKRNGCIGIVIPDDLLHRYIDRWFNGLTKTVSAKQYIDANRTFKNSIFQANHTSYINGINSEKIVFLNRKGNIDVLNMRRSVFKDNSPSKIKS